LKKLLQHDRALSIKDADNHFNSGMEGSRPRLTAKGKLLPDSAMGSHALHSQAQSES
jgi:hypothetical protein